MALRADPGTIQVWSDVGCPWSHAVVWRLWDARRRLGLERRVRFDHHAFPLELFNSEPTPRPKLEAEWPTVRDLAPRAGWEAWSAPRGAAHSSSMGTIRPSTTTSCAAPPGDARLTTSRTRRLRRSIGVHLPPFEKLIEAHATDLHRFLVASVGSGEAEDCLQETFMS